MNSQFEMLIVVLSVLGAINVLQMTIIGFLMSEIHKLRDEVGKLRDKVGFLTGVNHESGAARTGGR